METPAGRHHPERRQQYGDSPGCVYTGSDERAVQDSDHKEGAIQVKRRQRTPGFPCDIGHRGSRCARGVGSASEGALRQEALPNAVGEPPSRRGRGSCQDSSGLSASNTADHCSHQVHSTVSHHRQPAPAFKTLPHCPHRAHHRAHHKAQQQHTHEHTSTHVTKRSATDRRDRNEERQHAPPCRIGSKLAERAGDLPGKSIYVERLCNGVLVGYKLAEEAGN